MRKLIKAVVNKTGELVLPPETLARSGLRPGETFWVEVNENQIHLHPPITHLDRVYIEPTNMCNLTCRTCMRNDWDEPMGRMDEETFQRILTGIQSFPVLPTIFFGGYGEPLHHPRILSMLRQAKALGARVEMISNGILLREKVVAELIDMGLDMLWVSIDGASPESYADVRLGANLPTVIENLNRLHFRKYQAFKNHPAVGVAFVAMKRNIKDLPKVFEIGRWIGAQQFSISNVLAHDASLSEEVLYEKAIYDYTSAHDAIFPKVNWPRMDTTEETLNAFGKTLNGQYRTTIAGVDTFRAFDTCPFLEKNSTSIRWDGLVSPCLPLLHSHQSYLDDHLRKSTAYTVGSLKSNTLEEIWYDPGYMALRERLREFDFSPCTTCNSCDMAEANDEDCFGNEFPACGGCLWAQGLIQCP